MTEVILTETLLDNCARRAAGYDHENRFFFEDLEELRAVNYLLAAIPREFGGLGLSLSQICQEQRRLARRSALRRALSSLMDTLNLGMTWKVCMRRQEPNEWKVATGSMAIGISVAVPGLELAQHLWRRHC